MSGSGSATSQPLGWRPFLPVSDDLASALNAGPLAPVLRGMLRKNPAERMTLDQAQAMLAPLASSQPGRVPAPVVQQAPPAGPGQGSGAPSPQAGYGGRPYPGLPPLGEPVAGMPPSPGGSRWAGFTVAGAPALLSLLMLGTVAVLSRIEKPTVPVPESLPPALGAALNEHAKESLGVGCYLAVVLTVLIIGLGIIAFALANRDRARPHAHSG